MATFISAHNERWKFKATRKAAKEDKSEERADKTREISDAVAKFEKSEAEKNAEIDKRLDALDKQMEAQSTALRLILLDRILHLGQGYIMKGEISFDDRKRLHDMHDCYHSGLGGNGDADLIMREVDNLELLKN